MRLFPDFRKLRDYGGSGVSLGFATVMAMLSNVQTIREAASWGPIVLQALMFAFIFFAAVETLLKVERKLEAIEASKAPREPEVPPEVKAEAERRAALVQRAKRCLTDLANDAARTRRSGVAGAHGMSSELLELEGRDSARRWLDERGGLVAEILGEKERMKLENCLDNRPPVRRARPGSLEWWADVIRWIEERAGSLEYDDLLPSWVAAMEEDMAFSQNQR